MFASVTNNLQLHTIVTVVTIPSVTNAQFCYRFPTIQGLKCQDEAVNDLISAQNWSCLHLIINQIHWR